ncbi:MAG: hypothetical protein QE285_08500 [Aquabacterium sp.]|nr:hypothetical protein [Aquabacterium sp.]
MRSSPRLATAAVLCSLVGLGVAAPGDSASDPIITGFSNLTPFFTEVYNDRIGNSRLFNGPNTDRIRVSTRVYPSPDTDAFAVLNTGNGLWYQSTNGATTTVALAHPSMGTLPTPQPLIFVGTTSGLGGGRSEYTFSYNRANAAVAGVLSDWDATPFSLTANNPALAGGAKNVTYAAPDFDPTALPVFVTDVRLTGGGLRPRLDWTVPANGMAPTAVTIQVRRIEAESADRSRITRSTFLHQQNLSANATSYMFDTTFSNASLEGFPSGLEFGQRYEVAVQLEIASNGILKGRSRTFFELTPLADGGDQVAVYLPSVGPDGRFKFDIAVQRGESIAIDPEIAVGYDYAIGAGDPLFRSVKLPDLGDGQYGLWLWNGSAYSFQSGLAAGAEYFFDGAGVARFRIDGIEPSVGLNPSDPTAFVTGVSFAASGRFTGTMTPITVTVTVVPEPATLALWAGGLLLLLGRRLRQRA